MQVERRSERPAINAAIRPDVEKGGQRAGFGTSQRGAVVEQRMSRWTLQCDWLHFAFPLWAPRSADFVIARLEPGPQPHPHLPPGPAPVAHRLLPALGFPRPQSPAVSRDSNKPFLSAPTAPRDPRGNNTNPGPCKHVAAARRSHDSASQQCFLETTAARSWL